MSRLYPTFAVVAEDQYRRERAAHEFRAAGGTHHLGRFSAWRGSRRRNARLAGR